MVDICQKNTGEYGVWNEKQCHWSQLLQSVLRLLNTTFKSPVLQTDTVSVWLLVDVQISVALCRCLLNSQQQVWYSLCR